MCKEILKLTLFFKKQKGMKVETFTQKYIFKSIIPVRNQINLIIDPHIIIIEMYRSYTGI